MKKFLILLIFIIIGQLAHAYQPVQLTNSLKTPETKTHELLPVANTSENKVIQGSVSMVDSIPSEFFGSWKVTSVQTFNNNPRLFAPFSIDYWNLSKADNVITLTNPESGASASVFVNEVNGNTVKFTRTSITKNEKVTETPIITIRGENFYGTDKIRIETYKYGQVVRVEVIEYSLTAQKLSGASVNKILGK